MQTKQNEFLFLLLFVHCSVTHTSSDSSDDNNYSIKNIAPVYWALTMCGDCPGLSA